LHWWGVLALGIVNTNALSWYSIGCFFFTIFFLGGLLCSGRGANKLKRHHEFYNEKLAEIRAETQEKANKAEQEKQHEEKLKVHQAKLAEIAAAEAKA
jgi:steroid 5-alpha reductase family enzyme